MKKAAVCTLIIFSFLGCASMQDGMQTLETVKDIIIDTVTLKNQIPSEEKLLSFGRIQAQPGYLCFPLRADVVRQEKKSGENKTNMFGCTVTTDEFEPLDYTYQGLSLGIGLFVDSNGNLCFDLGELTGFSKMENCTLTVTDGNLLGEKTVLVKRGGTVTISEGNFIKTTTGIISREKGATIDRGFFSFNFRIQLSDDAVTFNPGGPFNFFTKEKIVHSGSRFVVPGFFMDRTFAETSGAGVLHITGEKGGSIKMVNEGKRIAVSSSGKTVSGRAYLVRSRERIVFYDETLFLGCMLDILDNNEFIYTEASGFDRLTRFIKLEKN